MGCRQDAEGIARTRFGTGTYRWEFPTNFYRTHALKKAGMNTKSLVSIKPLILKSIWSREVRSGRPVRHILAAQDN